MNMGDVCDACLTQTENKLEQQQLIKKNEEEDESKHRS